MGSRRGRQGRKDPACVIPGCTGCDGGGLDLLTKSDGADDLGKVVYGVAVNDPSKPAGRYRIIEAVVDSGAEESVTPPDLFEGTVRPSAMSRAGRKYRAANGSLIPNLGQLGVNFVTDEGFPCGLPFQVAEVERPLIVASALARAGNRVEFTADGGKIVNDKLGKVLTLARRGGVYVLRMRVPTKTSDFPRRGR